MNGWQMLSYLLKRVGLDVERCDIVMRKSITAEQRLATMLRYLATGRSLEALKFSIIIFTQALGKIIPETCRAIYGLLNTFLVKCNGGDEWAMQTASYTVLGVCSFSCCILSVRDPMLVSFSVWMYNFTPANNTYKTRNNYWISYRWDVVAEWMNFTSTV